MKKKTLFSFIVVLLVCSVLMACPLIPGNSSSGKKEKSEWTILVHFAIDNDIDFKFENSYGLMTNYLETLQAVEAADIDNNINIVVLMDCYNNDVQGTNYVSTFKDGYYYLTGGSFNDDLVVSKIEINSGSVTDTTDFMDWAVENYPAKKYVYSIFNHGGGFDDFNDTATRGIGFDDSNNGDALSHKELGETTSHLKSLTGKKIDLFYPYACLMGGVELAYEVKNNTEYILFSEDNFPAAPWSYEALEVLATTPQMGPVQLGKEFCNSAFAYFNNNRPFTLSLIDLSKMDQLYTDLDNYSILAISDINNKGSQAQYYNNAAKSAYTAGMDWWCYMDLGHYLELVSVDSNIGQVVKDSALTAISSLENAVEYRTHFGYENAGGMTIFHNLWNQMNYSIETYKNILSFGSNNWSNYMASLGGLTIPLVPDAYEDDDSFASAKGITIDAAAQVHSFDTADDVDYLKVNLTAGYSYKIQTYIPELSPVTIMLSLYNSSQDMLVSTNTFGGGFIEFECNESGLYYLKIEEFFKAIGYFGSTGDYSIDLVETASTNLGN